MEKMEVTNGINKLKKSELIAFIRLSAFVYGSKFFTATSYDKITLHYKDLKFWERVKASWTFVKLLWKSRPSQEDKFSEEGK